MEYKLYRPSNTSDAVSFEAEFCDRCRHEEGEGIYNCDIHVDALSFRIDEEGYPKEWCFNENGEAVCTAFSVK